MHDTAFKIGCLAMDIYSNLTSAKVLEIGSLNVNGSLRDHARECANYVGVDMEPGPDVDVVVTPGAALPFENETFDLVMASSVFEHDPAFWRTFVEMCRTTRKGGYIYISAPSNGTFHRYPEDHWRFYPDSGMALARWAQSEGQDIVLVESFVADRITEVYNDFVAVFRKGPTKKPLGKTFIYQDVICYNVRTWQSEELIHQRDATEDMVLIDRYKQDIQTLHTEVGGRDTRIMELQHQIAEEQTKSHQIWTERCVMEQLLRSAEQKALLIDARPNIPPRSEDAFKPLWETAQRELTELRKALGEAEVNLAKSVASLELETRTRQLTIDQLTARLDQQLAASEAKASASEVTGMQLERENAALRDHNAVLQNHNAALQAEATYLRGTVAGLQAEHAEALATQNQRHADAVAELERQIQWPRTACQVLLSQRSRWSWPTSERQQARRDAELLRRRLFDAAGYRNNNPDVAATGIDPLLHFILHGISEGRAPL